MPGAVAPPGASARPAHPSRRRAGLGALFVVVAIAAAPPRAAAQGGRRLTWSDDFRRADVGLFVATGTMAAGTVLADFFYRPLAPYAGRGPGLEDRLSGVFEHRDVQRRRLRRASRFLGLGASLQAKLVDPALVVWAGDRNGDVAGQLYALNGLALATTAFFTAIVSPSIRRPRPSWDRCLTDPEYDPTCGESDQVRSLVDPRLAVVITSAALTCTHHANLPLYGARWADALGCAGAASLAGTSALLAILADRQHPSDVIAAAVLGLLAGFVLPSVVGYRGF